MAGLALLVDFANGRLQMERVFRDHTDFLAHDDAYRLICLSADFDSQEQFSWNCVLNRAPTLERPTSRNKAIPAPVQILTTLAFLATGTFRRELADRSGISQPSLSLVMLSAWNGIIGTTQRCIRFPYNTSTCSLTVLISCLSSLITP